MPRPHDSHVDEILAPLKAGRVNAASVKGRALIGEALRSDPEATVRVLRPIDPTALREGMRSARFSERRIAQLVRFPALADGPVSNPFVPDTREPGLSPFPNPAEQLRRGPTPYR